MPERTTEELLKDAEGRIRRLGRLLEKSNEFRKSSDKQVYELAEELRVRIEKDLTLDSEITMNALLTKENQELDAKLKEKQWQPISTAPRSEMFIYRAKKNKIGLAYNTVSNTQREIYGEDITGVNGATHWMPIPQPPIEEKKQ